VPAFGENLMLQMSRRNRKKHVRRSAHQIDKTFLCPYPECAKVFGSEGSQNLHIKIKHHGGTKTEREKAAKDLVEAYVITAR